MRKGLGGNMPAKRIIITIPDEDERWLDGYAKVHKISAAEAVSQAISLLRQEHRQQTYQKLVENTCGIWKKGEGLAYQLEFRGEWE
jgi:hypothetical protein